MIPRYSIYFPIQRVSGKEKSKPEWYTNCIDYVIDAGISCNDRTDTKLQLEILHENIPYEVYKKTLNPYNAQDEKYTRFPATMRNFDIMSDIIRRYVSEYFKGVHSFIVGASNPNIVINKNAKLKETIMQAAEQAFQQEFQKRYNALLEEAEQQGIPSEQVDPNKAMPDTKEFLDNFNQNYIDKESEQGQNLLEYIRTMTEDNLIYLTAYFNYVALGECYTYTDIRGDKIHKECIPPMEAYPIPNSNFFVEDHDMFARKMMLSYQQIMDMFADNLSEQDKRYIEDYYSKDITPYSLTTIKYDKYAEYFPDICSRFSEEERNYFKHTPINNYEENTNLCEVWHVVWRGEAKTGILTYINEIGLQTTRIVDENYTLNKKAGDVSIEWVYEPQVYEGYRIGNRYNAIYPIKARPIAFNRKGKLPYNGIMEILPYFGKFSIIKLVSPFQIMRNIFIYHREMVIAKNKMLILLIPKSLLQSDKEDKIYRMAADGVLLVDDAEDTNSQKMANIRLLNANIGQYISELTALIDSIKQDAREIVDMNAQRYGQINQSSGVNNTRQAIAQSSMGSVIVNTMFDEYRKHDYNRDLDYARLAYIDGLDTSYWDSLGEKRYLSLDVNDFIGSDLSVTVRNSEKETEKLQELRNWAFNASQNGDLEVALSAITGDNIAQVKSAINKFTELKRKHEEDMQRTEQMLKQEEIQNKLREIEAKGNQDRLTEQLKYQYEMQLKYIDVNMDILKTSNIDETSKNKLTEISEETKRMIETSKLNLERQKILADTYNKAADREVKREEIKNQLKIAKTNKNRYDK